MFKKLLTYNKGDLYYIANWLYYYSVLNSNNQLIGILNVILYDCKIDKHHENITLSENDVFIIVKHASIVYNKIKDLNIHELKYDDTYQYLGVTDKDKIDVELEKSLIRFCESTINMLTNYQYNDTETTCIQINFMQEMINDNINKEEYEKCIILNNKITYLKKNVFNIK